MLYFYFVWQTDSQWLDWYSRYHIVNQYNTGPWLIIISQAIGEERILNFFLFLAGGSSNVLHVDLGVSRFKSTGGSRVESILLTSTTGFVDLSRFCFKSTWKRLNALLSLLSSILSVRRTRNNQWAKCVKFSPSDVYFWIRNWSHTATHLLVFGPTLFKKAFTVSNRIGKKFGRIVLQVNRPTRLVLGWTSWVKAVSAAVWA